MNSAIAASVLHTTPLREEGVAAVINRIVDRFGPLFSVDFSSKSVV